MKYVNQTSFIMLLIGFGVVRWEQALDFELLIICFFLRVSYVINREVIWQCTSIEPIYLIKLSGSE